MLWYKKCPRCVSNKNFYRIIQRFVVEQSKELERKNEQKISNWFPGKSDFLLKHYTFNPSMDVA